jgi:hypothetical protein
VRAHAGGMMNIEQRDETLHMMHEHAACAHRRRWAKRYASRKGFAAVDKLKPIRCDSIRFDHWQQ